MANSAAAGRIFISYRRDDASASAGRVYDRLVTSLGADRVFMDVDSIRPGVDFEESIEAAVGSCEVVLAIIGSTWLSATDEQGRRRLDNPNDWVVRELRAGLDRNIPIIPVLVGGAARLQPDQLPAALTSIARRQSIRLDHESFASDVAKLIYAVESRLELPTGLRNNELSSAQDPRSATVQTGAPVGRQSVPKIVKREAETKQDVKREVARQKATSGIAHDVLHRYVRRLPAPAAVVFVVIIGITIGMFGKFSIGSSESTTNGTRLVQTTTPLASPSPTVRSSSGTNSVQNVPALASHLAPELQSCALATSPELGAQFSTNTCADGASYFLYKTPSEALQQISSARAKEGSCATEPAVADDTVAEWSVNGRTGLVVCSSRSAVFVFWVLQTGSPIAILYADGPNYSDALGNALGVASKVR